MPVEQNDNTIVLKHSNGSTVEIYLYGATITSWKVNGKENLFVSKKSKLDGSAAIRGGIPVVFPIFGPPPSSPPEYAALKQHGFARNQKWELDRILLDRPEGVAIRMKAPAPPESFGHKYTLTYAVTLAAHQLVVDVHICNTGSEDFKFQSLLHSYLAVPDVTKIKISGIPAGVTYKDKAAGGINAQSTGDDLVIDKETDRVYAKLPGRKVHIDDGAGAGYDVRFNGFEDVVIWNPGEASASKMADMEDGGWRRYVCVEPGYVSEFKSIKPGELFIGQQVITLV